MRRPFAALAAAAAVLAGTVGVVTTNEGLPVVLVPAAIPADCSRPVEAELNWFLGTVPNDHRVLFPPNGCYAAAGRIVLFDKGGLVVDGNGSTFRTTANGCTTQSVNGNWIVVRGSNVTLRNMTAVGSFNLPGPRSLAAESADPCYTEGSPNYGIYGTEGAWLIDVKGHNAWGDSVTLGPTQNAVPAPAPGDDVDYANDVHIIRMEARKASRHCWGPTSGVGVWIEDSTCTDAWYAALDAETDTLTQPLRGHHYLRNTFSGFNLGGLFIPVPGPHGLIGDIEIRGNRFLTPPDVACNQTILVGAYPDADSPPRSTLGFDNVRVEGNELRTYTRAVNLDRVNGGTVTGNRIENLVPPAGSTVAQFCGADPGQVVVTNSVNVTVNAAEPPPVDPGPAPTLPTTTTRPSATTTTRPAPATTTTRPGRCLNLNPTGRICVIE